MSPIKARYSLRCLRSRNHILCSSPLHIRRQLLEPHSSHEALVGACSHDGASAASLLWCCFGSRQLASFAASNSGPGRLLSLSSCDAGKGRFWDLQPLKSQKSAQFHADLKQHDSLQVISRTILWLPNTHTRHHDVEARCVSNLTLGHMLSSRLDKSFTFPEGSFLTPLFVEEKVSEPGAGTLLGGMGEGTDGLVMPISWSKFWLAGPLIT